MEAPGRAARVCVRGRRPGGGRGDSTGSRSTVPIRRGVMATRAKRILILGGGFAGVYTGRTLEKLLAPAEADITLVNRENYWVYQPMLPEVISGSIGLTDVVSPIRRLCPRTRLVMRELEAIDLETRVVTVSPGFRPWATRLLSDYLLLVFG